MTTRLSGALLIVATLLFPLYRVQAQPAPSLSKARPALDLAVPDIKADQVWSLHDQHNLPIMGQHVLVGEVDTGIDYHNPDFKNSDGSSRIKYIWDQTLRGSGPQGTSFNYGIECDGTSINSGKCAEQDVDGHGTWTSGIAAGNGRSATPGGHVYMGVAPQADIMMVKTDFSSEGISDAWKYLIQRAHELHEPLVINNSIGTTDSPHDGSDPDSQAATKLAGPGAILVAAAGNEGGQGEHFHGTLSQGPTSVDYYTAGSFGLNGFPLDVGFTVFFDARDQINFTLGDTLSGDKFGPISEGETLERPRSNSAFTVTLKGSKYNDQYREMNVDVQVDIRRLASFQDLLALQGDKLTLGITPVHVEGNGRFDIWSTSDGFGQFAGYDEANTIDAPADSPSVIAVTNYATRPDWTDVNGKSHNICDEVLCQPGGQKVGDIAGFSGIGPTLDGRQKPDIAAPGTMIISSLSGDTTICHEPFQPSDLITCLPPETVTPDHHLINTGSSASAPMVTGAVALMLQVNPNLDQQTVTTVLRSTTRHDQFTGNSSWSPIWGAGKLDALAAVQAVMPQAAPTSTATVTPLPTATPLPTNTPIPTSTPVPTSTPIVAQSCPKNAQLKNGKCACKKGYTMKKGKCVKKKK